MNWQNRTISRRTFFKIIGGLAAGTAGMYALLPRRVLDSLTANYLPIDSDEAMYIRQIITADSTRSRTIMWQSAAAVAAPTLEYRVKGTDSTSNAAIASERFTDNQITSSIHTAMLTDLTPGTAYEYRVGCGDKRDQWRSFDTASENGAFKALIFPDSQSSDYSDWEKVAQAARQAHPDAAFFVNMGDLVDNGEDASQWRGWFDALHGIVDTIPLAPVLGNHEAYDLNWEVRMPAAYLHLFSTPPNGREAFQNQYYSFDYGDAHFIVLNTQFDEMLQFQPELLEAQRDWFERDITQTKKKWKIVLMHKDVLTYEIRSRTDRKAGISDIGREFMPLFDRHGVDVVLTAHLHTYRRRVRLRNFRPDARGPLYTVTGVAGNVRYPNLWIDHPFDDAVAPQPETNNYMTLTLTADSLQLASFLPSGKQIDFVEVRK